MSGWVPDFEEGPVMTPPNLIHLATVTVNLSKNVFFIPNGPKGTRVVADVDDVTFVGDRLNASMVGSAAADWLTLGPDGSYGVLDVRFTMKTDDGAVIYCEYGGRIDLATNKVVAAPSFQCGDERYDWLNRIQAVAAGTNNTETGVLVYEFYEVAPA